jgi:2-dehydro-3-deoxygluconokinase
MVELSQSGDGLMRRSFAGDVLNTLWYARQGLDRAEAGKGFDVSFLSAVGTDPMSDRMLAFIGAAGIGTARVRRIADRGPGLYMIHLDGAERSFTYWRDSSAARLLAQDRRHVADAFKAASAIYFSGITLAILSKDDRAFFIGALRQAADQGRIVAFDSNIRPALWPDRVTMTSSIAAAASCATVALPSFDEEARAFGDADPQATAARYRAAGCGLVVVKNGHNDVVLSEAATLRAFPTPQVPDPVDTTGAGDSFNGAFLAALISGMDVAQAVRRGQACAGEVIRHHGALIPMGRG